MVLELGRLVYEVKVDKVGDDKKSVLNNKIAISSGKEKTTFLDIVAWGGTADLIGKYFKKGYEIYVEGHLINKIRKKENVEFEAVVLNIENIKFTNGNPKEDVEPFL
ncbi:single-stranded DNA-binding protein [Clostridium botulinum]|nr:single-stranded DNA-binding protein [Clostridium botulinum]